MPLLLQVSPCSVTQLIAVAVQQGVLIKVISCLHYIFQNEVAGSGNGSYRHLASHLPVSM